MKNPKTVYNKNPARAHIASFLRRGDMEFKRAPFTPQLAWAI